MDHFYSVCIVNRIQKLVSISFWQIMWDPNIESIYVSKCMKMFDNSCLRYFENIYHSIQITWVILIILIVWLVSSSTSTGCSERDALSRSKFPVQNWSNFWYIRLYIYPDTKLSLSFGCIFVFFKVKSIIYCKYTL